LAWFWFVMSFHFQAIQNGFAIIECFGFRLGYKAILNYWDRFPAIGNRPITLMLGLRCGPAPTCQSKVARFLGQHVGEGQLRRRARLIQDLIQTAGPLAGVAATAVGSIAGLKGVVGQ
jgi:hypothetical protein